MTPKDFFKPNGLISSVKPGFAQREGQQDLAELILEGMYESKPVLAEAPTGFGKSFAALVPAIIQAVKEGKRVVIATETLTLQDQYVEKDLVTLAQAVEPLGVTLKFATAKGKQNFVCRLKLLEAPDTPLTRWANLQQLPQDSGDIASTDIEFDVAEWRTIGADDDCEKTACDYYGNGIKGNTDCFAYHARNLVAQAQIVVTNHTLFLLDAEVGVGTLLGPYDFAIIDEAHGFAEKAQDVWGQDLRATTLHRTLLSIDKSLTRVGMETFLLKSDFDRAKEIQQAIFGPLQSIKDTTRFDNLPDTAQLRVVAGLEDAVEFLRDINVRLKTFVRSDSSPRDAVITTASERINKLVGTLRGITGNNVDEEYKENWLSFVEVGWSPKQGGKTYTLKLKPIIVAPLMRSRLLDKPEVQSVAFLSATMRVNNSFGFIKSEFGLAKDEALEFTGDSPFDFFEQVKAYLPQHLPEQREEGYIYALEEEIIKLIHYTKGRTLVLFTNVGNMQTVYEEVSKRVPYKCYLQGQAPRGTLLDMFAQETDSCLFATRSFFTGVDIPGEALSSVVLTKAPFRVPSDPIFKAKCDLIEEQGRSSFNTLSLPLMVFDVRQAFGRLIRTETDKGVFALLDSRALKSSYKGKLLGSLPQMQTLTRATLDKSQ